MRNNSRYVCCQMTCQICLSHVSFSVPFQRVTGQQANLPIDKYVNHMFRVKNINLVKDFSKYTELNDTQLFQWMLLKPINMSLVCEIYYNDKHLNSSLIYARENLLLVLAAF